MTAPKHERQALREAVQAALLYRASPSDPRPTSANDRVFKSRRAPLRNVELPAVCVYTEDETMEKYIESPRELLRHTRVAIDCWVKASDDVDDVLDALTLQVETAMDRDLTLGGTAFDSGLVSTEIAIQLEGDRPIACAHMVYDVITHTLQRVGDAVDDFNTFDVVNTALGKDDGIAGDNQPHDHVTGIHQP